MYLALLFLPFFSFSLCSLGGKYIGSKGAQWLSTLLLFLATLFSLVIFYEVSLVPTSLVFFPWISTLSLSWGFLFDSLTVVMLVVVSSISVLVHFYSIGYMQGDPHLPRFMSYLSLFTFAMFLLVTADNFLQLFLGWEGVGIVSYLLINFWHTRIQATKSAIKAVLVNRIGDIGLSLGIVAIYITFEALDFSTVFGLVPYVVDESFILLGIPINKLSLIAFFLFMGAVGKSAQLGLHIWLPDAMEGPTPVSALIHAATMVTAGIFLILRSSILFEYAPSILNLVILFGALTAFFAASTGLLQNDLKKIIAYSTCSQLGYMVFACGLSHYSLSLFHLMNHAFFKALLFLGAGSIIHALKDEQDIRRMGGMLKRVPFTYSLMVIGSFSLLGFPFLSGFYSKDMILEVARSQWNVHSSFAYWLGTLSVFFTAFYSIRLLFLTFLNGSNSYKKVVDDSHESSAVMLIPLVLLAFGSLFLGYLSKDMFIGLGTGFWNYGLVSLPLHGVIIEAEFLPSLVKMIPLFFSFIGFSSAFLLYTYFPSFLIECKLFCKEVYAFFNKKWYFDKVLNEYLVAFTLTLGYQVTFKGIDRGILELLGPYGLVFKFKEFSKGVSEFQTGMVYHYAFLMILGVTFYMTFFSWGLNFSYLLIALGLAFFV